MKSYQAQLQKRFLWAIQDGRKTIEGRLRKRGFAEMVAGDSILFNETTAVKITSINNYTTLKEMVEREGHDKLIPGSSSDEEALDVYDGFYSKEDEEEFGVVAVHFSLIK